MSREEEDERPGAALTLTSAVFVPGVEVVVLGIAVNKEHYNGSCLSFRIAMHGEDVVPVVIGLLHGKQGLGRTAVVKQT